MKNMYLRVQHGILNTIDRVEDDGLENPIQTIEEDIEFINKIKTFMNFEELEELNKWFIENYTEILTKKIGLDFTRLFKFGSY